MLPPLYIGFTQKQLTVIQPLQITSLTPHSTRSTTPTRRVTSGYIGQPQFGQISPAVLAVDGAMQLIQKTRIQEMIIEDIMGYGVLRSAMDYFRPSIYKAWGAELEPSNIANEPAQKKSKGNLPAARERIVRETVSIFTDIIAPGLVGMGIGKTLAKKTGTLNDKMIDDKALGVFEQLLKQSNSPKQMVEALASELALNQPQQLPAITKQLMDCVNPNIPLNAEQAAVNIAKRLGKKELDVIVKGKGFMLDALLKDAAIVYQGVTPLAKSSQFKTLALNLIKKTVENNHWMIPAGMAAGLGLTFAVPYLNLLLTRKLDNLKSYPAEMGLRPIEFDKNPLNQPYEKAPQKKSFSYVLRQIKEGDPLPLLVSLIPLSVTAGFVDTVKLSAGQWSKAFVNPLGKGFMKNFIGLNQFGKAFPYTTQQQIASLYAALITSRLLFSRSDIEYRERLIDSWALGWMVWILGTPALKRFFAGRSDKLAGTQLLKKVGGAVMMRSRLEIEKLLPQNTATARKIAEKTLSKAMIIGPVSFLGTLLTLGVLEPLLAMRWSLSQAKAQQNRSST